MDMKTAVAALSALAQPTRLEAFRILVRYEPDGMPAGDVARALDVPQNTSSTHLAILVGAGLARSERDGRSIVYRADLDAFRELTLFLLKDCCSGRAELCVPLMKQLKSCC
jgi:DNA-binding transcriptional ArsR family regulator